MGDSSSSQENTNGSTTGRPLLDHHREHLRTSGLSDETIAAAGFYSIVDPFSGGFDVIHLAAGW